eukprot:TRINITY_DN13761_c0_g1_i2.p2 TRINITY_DN13761_c0_g1~~TRINITY_DN13761_c0_g1_i2.p2  ORF type:complete len:113 (+),score=24.78 TRINITY_DN13761_c0_g1_i2:95-433(+)
MSRLVGLALAKELIFTGRRISATEAQRIGLVNHAVDAGAATQKALEIAREISTAGPIAVAAAKEAISAGFHLGMEAALAVEKTQYDRVIPTADRREGLLAFKEKRTPSYKGH